MTGFTLSGIGHPGGGGDDEKNIQDGIIFKVAPK
jgi:hypothetical protein